MNGFPCHACVEADRKGLPGARSIGLATLRDVCTARAQESGSEVKQWVKYLSSKKNHAPCS
jgi:hypothetical protein